jgi:hypothetical protein
MLMLALVIVVLCIAAAVLSAPLVLQRLEPYATAAPPRADPRDRERLLDALSELEHSRLSGKLSEADYAAQRERLEADYLRVTAAPDGEPG